MMLIFLNNPCGSSVSLSTIAKDDVFFRCMSKRNGATSSGIEGTPYKPVNEVTDEFGMCTIGIGNVYDWHRANNVPFLGSRTARAKHPKPLETKPSS